MTPVTKNIWEDVEPYGQMSGPYLIASINYFVRNKDGVFDVTREVLAQPDHSVPAPAGVFTHLLNAAGVAPGAVLNLSSGQLQKVATPNASVSANQASKLNIA